MRKLLVILLIGVVCLLVAFTQIPINYHNVYVQRKLAKVEKRLGNWLDIKPKRMAITGNVGEAKISVFALYTSPNWISLTSSEGSFFLPEILWSPGAIYTLVFTDNINRVEKIDFLVPFDFPRSGVWNVGDIRFSNNRKSDITSLNSVTHYVKYDSDNHNYYQSLFLKVTSTKLSDREKLDELNKYLSRKRVKKKKIVAPVSAQQLLSTTEPYSYSCGEMSNAMAMLAQSANYKVRLLGVMKLGENNAKNYTHELVEIFYDNDWHLYDPTYGIAYLKENAVVASYRDLRNNPSLLAQHPIVTRGSTLAALYETGVHHITYLR